MYLIIKQFIIRILKVPPIPEPPEGKCEKLKTFRASYNYYKYKFYTWILKKTIGIPASIIFIIVSVFFIYSELADFEHEKAGFYLAAAVGIFMVLFTLISTFISYFVLRIDYEMRWYMLSNRSIRIREGVFFVKEMTLSIENIQNVSITQGPIQRYFGIADVKVRTAGGGGAPQQNQNNEMLSGMHLAFFRGVDNFKEIKNLIMIKLQKVKNSGLGDPDEEDKKNYSATPENSISDLIPIFKNLEEESAKLNKLSLKNLPIKSKSPSSPHKNSPK